MRASGLSGLPARSSVSEGPSELRGMKLLSFVWSDGRGRSNISIAGRLPVSADAPVADLVVEATDLSLDADLRDALSADALKAWDMLQPSGQANVTFRLIGAPKTRTAPSDASGSSSSYRLIIHPRDMRVKYRHFPYPLKLVSGVVVVDPKSMKLDSITGLAGDVKILLDGLVSMSSTGEQADLSISTGAIAMDRQFLDAVPEELVEAMRLSPGGTVELATEKSSGLSQGRRREAGRQRRAWLAVVRQGSIQGYGYRSGYGRQADDRMDRRRNGL